MAETEFPRRRLRARLAAMETRSGQDGGTSGTGEEIELAWLLALRKEGAAGDEIGELLSLMTMSG